MNAILRNLDLHFQGQTFHMAIFTSKCGKMQIIIIAIRLEVRYLQSNGATVNAAHYDLDVDFQGHEF